MIRKLIVSSHNDIQITNKQYIVDKLKLAIKNNKKYLEIGTPTATQRNEQVVDLTRQLNQLIRLVLQDFKDSN